MGNSGQWENLVPRDLSQLSQFHCKTTPITSSEQDPSSIWGLRLRFERPHFPEPGLSRRIGPGGPLPARHPWTYVPRYLYSGLYYPDFASGAGYVVPAGASGLTPGVGVLECLYRSGLELPYFHVNDVFLTGFARGRCSGGGGGVRLRHDSVSFRLDPTESDLVDPEVMDI